MKKKNIAYVDKVYYDGTDKAIYGCLDYEFCDKDDTRVPASEVGDLLSTMKEALMDEDALVNETDYDGSFSIYYVVTATIKQEGWETETETEGTIVEGSEKVKAVFVCATEERVKAIVEGYRIFKEQEGVEFVYAEEEPNYEED
jgi:hypothetical protein